MVTRLRDEVKHHLLEHSHKQTARARRQRPVREEPAGHQIQEVSRKIDAIFQLLTEREGAVNGVNSRPPEEPEFYTTAQFGEKVDKSEYTVRQWCLAGRINCQKGPNGRAWLIPGAEVARYKAHGLLPLPKK